MTAGSSFDDLFANWQASKVPAQSPVKTAKVEPEWTAADDRLVADFRVIEDRAQQAIIIVEALRSKKSA